MGHLSRQRRHGDRHAGGPALRLGRAGQPDALVDLARGSLISVDADVAKSVAAAAAPSIIGQVAAIVAYERIDVDQWTVGRYVRDRPARISRRVRARETDYPSLVYYFP